jgi:hypothetical protein
VLSITTLFIHRTYHLDCLITALGFDIDSNNFSLLNWLVLGSCVWSLLPLAELAGAVDY